MLEEYAARRAKLAAQLPAASLAILPGAKLQYRNSDAEFPFRQNSNFYYLTGFSEPEACLVLTKDADAKVKFILFNRARDVEAEVWTGPRAGQEGAREQYAADEAYPFAELTPVVERLFSEAQTLFCPANFDLSAWAKPPTTVKNILPLIHEMRLIKSEQEIECMRKAAVISSQAHAKIMRSCAPKMFEYQLEAVFVEHCLQTGCRALAYTPIVASGSNACILHYIENNRQILNNDLVLVDAGVEYQNYAADITRTFPANGKFTAEQRTIYELVLRAQEAGIAKIMPGNTWNQVQDAMLDVMVPELIQLGILQGKKDDLIASKAYRKFYMHSSGHWLGLDVHDSGEYKIDDKWRKFVPGMVLTVEPGIYISPTCDSVDPKWRGIGVRIEDDVLVTKAGHEILSIAAPKQLAEIERAAL